MNSLSTWGSSHAENTRIAGINLVGQYGSQTRGGGISGLGSSPRKANSRSCKWVFAGMGRVSSAASGGPMYLPMDAESIGSLGSSLWLQLKDKPDAAGAEQQHCPLAFPQPHPQMVGESSPSDTAIGTEEKSNTVTTETTAANLQRRDPEPFAFPETKTFTCGVLCFNSPRLTLLHRCRAPLGIAEVGRQIDSAIVGRVAIIASQRGVVAAHLVVEHLQGVGLDPRVRGRWTQTHVLQALLSGSLGIGSGEEDAGVEGDELRGVVGDGLLGCRVRRVTSTSWPEPSSSRNPLESADYGLTRTLPPRRLGSSDDHSKPMFRSTGATSGSSVLSSTRYWK